MNKTLYKSLSCLPLLIISVILELLPEGAVYNMSTEPGQVRLETFSYFDSSVFSYTNFAPMATAVATCVALLLLGVYCACRWYWFVKASKHFVFAGIVFSFLPLLLGIHQLSTIGVLITATLTVQLAVMHFLIKDPKAKK